MGTTYDIGLVGAGIMGSAMARNWLADGHRVTVWNRTRSKAEALAGEGAIVAETAVEAADGCDYLVTMVADGDAVREVIEQSDGLLDALGPEGVWLQMSTIGVDDIEWCLQQATSHGIDLVDAPVLGTKQPAETGELTVLAGADEARLGDAEEVFDSIASTTRHTGGVGSATRTKLVCNTWVVGLLGVLSETMALADGLDVEPSDFLESIAGGPLDAGYAHIKGEMMQTGEYPASFPLRLALKDANLVLDAAEQAGLDCSVVRGIADLLERAAESGHGDEDMAAAFEAACRRMT
jgi:3-hydroxyisobutyrate dehydrogenase